MDKHPKKRENNTFSTFDQGDSDEYNYDGYTLWETQLRRTHLK